jgi:hypothetical protein
LDEAFRRPSRLYAQSDCPSLFRYITAAHRQRTIAYADSQEQAARCYDAALWRLYPFTPKSAKPNFPDDFESITQADVETLCPNANKIYDELVSALPPEVTVQSLLTLRRDAALHADVISANQRGRPTAYAALESAVNKAYADIFNHKVRINNARFQCTFGKIPELVSSYDEAARALVCAERELFVLHEKLEHYREYYIKLNQ